MGISEILCRVTYVCMHVKLLQSLSTLWDCDPMDYSPPGSSIHGVLQARILEWVAMLSYRGSSQPQDQAHVSYVSCISRKVLYYQLHLGSLAEQQQAAKKVRTKQADPLLLLLSHFSHVRLCATP